MKKILKKRKKKLMRKINFTKELITLLTLIINLIIAVINLILLVLE